eukprot:jgi/Undpi1/10709/HiC_scaffold_29.g13157.m1
MVFLQGLPFDRIVDQIARRIPGTRGAAGLPVPFGGGGGGEGEGGGEDGESAAAAVGGEESSMSSTSGGIFGGAGSLPSTPESGKTETLASFEEADHGFTEPPVESGSETTWSEGSFGSEGGAPDAASDGEGERKREDDVSVGKGGSEGGGGEFFMKTLHRLVGGKGDDAGDDSGDWDWD